MRVVIVGLGVQGQKRRTVAGRDVVAVVDPVNDEASHRRLSDVPGGSYDAALLCTPDDVKVELMVALLAAGKHILVEKPLVRSTPGDLEQLAALAAKAGAACYTAYNHRFEPNLARLRELLVSGTLGRIYTIRLFYGNGTARLVRESAWRDSGSGVLRDLGSHLLDLLRFLLGDIDPAFRVTSARRFENRAYDHVVIASSGEETFLELEMSLLSWRNHFSCDVYAEKGSAHVSSLCKWGTSTFTHRQRVLPSGTPTESSTVSKGPDPTWELEYRHFLRMCERGGNNLSNDIWIDAKLAQASEDAAKSEQEWA